MHATALPLSGLLLLQPRIHHDDRGHFLESYNQAQFHRATGLTATFVQDNHSHSHYGVLRGLHYQIAPHQQGKLIRVVAGRIWDVALDLRPHSPTFGQHYGIELNADTHQQLWLPAGIAHGYLTLSPSATVHYKTTAYYSPAHERSLRWNDPHLAIAWPPLGQPPILSAKDENAPTWAQLQRAELSS